MMVRIVTVALFFRFLLLLSLGFVVVVHSAPPKKAAAEPLYGDRDDVISLRDDNFDYTVLATSNAWLVEFYNSWCGHCIRYAPLYKRLATETKGWRPFLKVAAVDCSQDYNRDLCQFFDIKMYPTLKFFPAFASKRTNGTNCPGYDSVEHLRIAIVEFISNANLSSIGGRKLSLLQPIDEMWQPLKYSYRTAVVIFEQEQSTLGRRVILDMFGQSAVIVRRMLAGNASKYGVSQIPSMYLVDNDNGNFKLLAVGDNCTNYVTILKNLISTTASVQSSPPQEIIKPSEPLGNPELPRENLNNIRELNVDDAMQFDRPTEIYQKSEAQMRQKEFNLLSENYLKVHEQDLESSLHYSLRHEVAMFKTISDEALLALKKYIKVLAKFLPVQRPISLFLSKVDDWLENESGPITGVDWLKAINRLQSSTEILPESDIWTGCQGSMSKYRGYPCSLWTTFHTLTVAAYDRMVKKHEEEEEEDVHGADVKEVLLAVRGYVKFFFGCRECSENFMRRSVHIEELVHSARSGVLFLWKAHNRANHFLAGDLTEDPAHPKVQFPTAEQCPFCHKLNNKDSSDGSFNEKEVLVFLQNMYTKDHLIPDSPRLQIREPEKNDNHLDASFQQVHKREDFGFQRLGQKEKLTGNAQVSSKGLKTISLNGMGPVDIGMCVVFYVFCLAFLVVVYLRFVKPRSLRMFSNGCKLPV